VKQLGLWKDSTQLLSGWAATYSRLWEI